MNIRINRNNINFNLLKENLDKYVEKLAGKDENLEETIRDCVGANIPVLACKGSDNIFSSARITLEYNGNTLEQITALLNEVSNIKGTKIVFATTGKTKKPFNVTISCPGVIKDKVFATMSQCIKEKRKEKKLRPELIDAVNVAIHSDYLRTTSKVTVYNNLFKRKYMVESSGINDTLSMSANTYNHGKKFAIAKEKFAVDAKDLHLISRHMEDFVPEIHNTKKITKNGFQLDMTKGPMVKIANISKFNADYEDTTGSIKRTR